MFESSSVAGTQACVDIVIINDTDVECDDTFSVVLSTTELAVTIPDGSRIANITIEPDPSDGKKKVYVLNEACNFILMPVVITIGLDQSNYGASETTGSVMVCAEIMAMTGTLESDVELTLITSDGTATGL